MEFLITIREATTILALIKTLAREYESKKRPSAPWTFCTAGEKHKSLLRRPQNKRDYTLLWAHYKRPGCDSSLHYTFFAKELQNIFTAPGNVSYLLHTHVMLLTWVLSVRKLLFVRGKGVGGHYIATASLFYVFIPAESCAGNSYYVHRDIMSSRHSFIAVFLLKTSPLGSSGRSSGWLLLSLWRRVFFSSFQFCLLARQLAIHFALLDTR